MYIKIYHCRPGILNKNNKYKNSIFIIKYIGKKTNHKQMEINSTGLAQNNIELNGTESRLWISSLLSGEVWARSHSAGGL